MRNALATDLAAGGMAEVLILRDRRFGPNPPAACKAWHCDDWPSERDAFQAAARWAEATAIIAPEFAGILAARHDWAAAVGAVVLGASRSLVELAADKQRTAEHLAKRGVRVPQGRLLAAGDPLPRDFTYPAVLKPVDGAGSLDVRWLTGPDDLVVLPPTGRAWRLERFCPGLAASVALLCGPAGVTALPGCRQLLGDAGPTDFGPRSCGVPSFAYRGGLVPLAPPLDERARHLARQAAATLEGACGWLGIDLVLGDDPGGGNDTVIEINPRLTTSYLGLRALAHNNLGVALLAAVRGEPAPLSLAAEPLQFAPDGRITRLQRA